MVNRNFVHREYVDALKLLVELEKQNDAWELVDMKEKTFVLKVRRLCEFQTYYLNVFVRPDELGMYLFMSLSDEYNNVRVVPQPVNDLVAEKKEKGELKIFRQESNVDDIDLQDIKSEKEEGISFCFWAVKYVLFKDKPLDDVFYKFLYKAEKVKDEFDSIYSRSY